MRDTQGQSWLAFPGAQEKGRICRKRGGWSDKESFRCAYACCPNENIFQPKNNQGGATVRVHFSLQGPSLIIDTRFSVWSFEVFPPPCNQRRISSLPLKTILQDAERCGEGPVCSLCPPPHLSSPPRASPTRELRIFWLEMDPTPSLHPPQLLSGSSSAVSFLGASLSCCGLGPSSAS